MKLRDVPCDRMFLMDDEICFIDVIGGVERLVSVTGRTINALVLLNREITLFDEVTVTGKYIVPYTRRII